MIWQTSEGLGVPIKNASPQGAFSRWATFFSPSPKGDESPERDFYGRP